LREAGVVIETELVRDRSDRQESLADISLAQKSLTLRNWRPGDRFWPKHSKASRKIKELLQDRHITGDRKKLWPVIASGDDVVWMYDFGVHRDLLSKNGSGILIRAEPLKS